ncbi:MAG: hypothetical protein Q9201_006874 [Fulgogasparrea decipioides]
MATGMPTWVTKTLGFLSRPIAPSIRSTIRDPQGSDCLAENPMPLPPKGCSKAGGRRVKSMKQRSRPRSSRLSDNISFRSAHKSTQTDNPLVLYEHMSTQTDDLLSAPALDTKHFKHPPSPFTQQSAQTDNIPLVCAKGSVQTLGQDGYNGLILEENFQTLASSEPNGNPTTTPDVQNDGQGMDLNEEMASDQVQAALEQDLGVKDAQMLDGPSYTDGDAQIVMANDGLKDCLALLLTAEMVAKVNQVATRARRLECITGSLRKAKQEVTSAENMIEYKAGQSA